MQIGTGIIYERNPDTNVIRWRYVGESMRNYSWPHYGNILKDSHTCKLKGK